MQLHVAVAAVQELIQPAPELVEALTELDGEFFPQFVADLAVRDEVCRLQQELVGVERAVQCLRGFSQ